MTPAKKGTGLQGIIDSLTPDTIDNIRKTSPAAADKFGPLLAKLNVYLNRDLPFWPDKYKERDIPDLVSEVLTPLEIDTFLQISLLSENKTGFCSKAGDFITHLIGNSYHGGHRKFVLHTNVFSNPLEDIGHGLIASRENPLSVVVYGDSSDYFGFLSQNVRYTIHGDVRGDYCARTALNCTFLFYERIVGEDIALGA
ncbi:MAG TPA: hypothetical protein VJI32_04930 [Candidatus Nanoarchaeia archaeon]|nr:hypothetical protein [Candidatus Nanoarchaeia archaeon]